MRGWGALQGLVIAGGLAALPTLACAGAWNLPKGDGLVIFKYEPVTADRGFNASGVSERLERRHEEDILSVWAEYGLNDRVTLMLKTDWQDSQDQYHDFQGRGVLEAGARFQVLKRGRSAVALQATYGHDGEGRNASWAEPGQGDHEGELRLLAGHGFDRRFHTYVETQIARRWRDGLASETRLEMAVGMDINPRWTLLGQAYVGKVDDVGDSVGPEWTKLEAGVIRHMGPWSAQAGWRTTTQGRRIVEGDGLVVALWRRF